MGTENSVAAIALDEPLDSHAVALESAFRNAAVQEDGKTSDMVDATYRSRFMLVNAAI